MNYIKAAKGQDTKLKCQENIIDEFFVFLFYELTIKPKMEFIGNPPFQMVKHYSEVEVKTIGQYINEEEYHNFNLHRIESPFMNFSYYPVIYLN